MVLVAALWLLLIASALTGVYYAAVLVRAVQAMTPRPTLRAGLAMDEPEGGWPPLCVIVPAHNEEGRIGGVARSLMASTYPGLRVVFALDRCEDETGARLREAIDAAGGDVRVSVMRIEECPEGWAGKTNAMWRGAQDAGEARDAQLLAFIDADTTVEPECLRAAVAMLVEKKLGLLSLLSTLRRERWWEVVAQPVAAVELMRTYPLDRVNDPSSEKAFANGQFMLFDRAEYERFGGHEWARAAVLEDLALAKRVKHMDGTLGVYFADGLLRCAMYETWASFRAGWRRILVEGLSRRVGRMRKARATLLAMGVVAPAACVFAVGVGVAVDHRLSGFLVALGAAGLSLWLLLKVVTYRAQGAPLWGVLAAPLGALLVVGIYGDALRQLRRGEATVWGGKSYAREAR